METINVVSPPC